MVFQCVCHEVSLLLYTEQAQDINLDVKRDSGFHNFWNKIWNAFKFSWIALGEGFQTNTSTEASVVCACAHGCMCVHVWR